MDQSKLTESSLEELGSCDKIVEVVTCTWTLPQEHISRDKMTSPIFSDDSKKYKFRLTFHNGILFFTSLNKSELFIKYQCHAIDLEEQRYFSMKNFTGLSISEGKNYRLRLRRRFYDPDEGCLGDDEEFDIYHYTNRYRHSDSSILTVSCTFVIIGKETDNKITRDLSNDFNVTFENMKYSDVILNVQGKEFCAHKVFLTSRSPVFSAMFENEMEESKTNKVFIQDVSHDAFQEMLRFIYTGKVVNLKGLAIELLEAADKYTLDELKKMCENVLKLNITVENVCEILMLADLHSAFNLKEKAIEFINNNGKSVSQSISWDHMVEQNPRLVSELYRNLVLKN